MSASDIGAPGLTAGTLKPSWFQRSALRRAWASQSLARQFLLTGGLVSFVTMILVGLLVTALIEANVTRHSAAATALYVDSVIAPLLPDMQRSEVLGDAVTRALDETLGQGALGRRLMSFRLWRRDGTILYANDRSLIGRQFAPSADLQAAFAGRMIARLDEVDDVESVAEGASGKSLLEIYNPVLQPWSGEVVAVSEFYEVANEFERTLRQAVLWSWLAVAAGTLGFFSLLSFIVLRGSRTIDEQSRALEARVSQLSALLTQNDALRERVQRASQRAAEVNEGYLRRIGADLHDGPAQLVALAALRLDNCMPGEICDGVEASERQAREIGAIKSTLDDAMQEIRSISRGLVLPQVEAAELPEIVRMAVAAHEQRSGVPVQVTLGEAMPVLSPSARICVYRFLQEALNNGYRHGKGAAQSVTISCMAGWITVEVADAGPGFEPLAVPPDRLGLAGLRERIDSLGGRFVIESSEEGTLVTMFLATEEEAASEAVAEKTEDA